MVDGLDALGVELLPDLGDFLRLGVLAREALHHPDAADAVSDERREVAQPGSGSAVGGAHRGVVARQQQAHDQHRERHHHTQQRLQRDEDGDHTDES